MILEHYTRPEKTELNPDCNNCHNFDITEDWGEPFCYILEKENVVKTPNNYEISINEQKDFMHYMLFGDRPPCPFRVKDYYDDI